MASPQMKRLPDKEKVGETSPKKIKLCNVALQNSSRKKMSMEHLLTRTVMTSAPLNHDASKAGKRSINSKNKKNGKANTNKEADSAIHTSNCRNSFSEIEERIIVDDKIKENDPVQVNKDAVSPTSTSENCSNSSINIEERALSVSENIPADSSKNENLFIEGNLVWAKLTLKESYWPALILKRETTGFSSCNENQCCVFWLKDNRLSKVPKKYIMDYASFVPRLTLKKNENGSRAEAIYESIDLYTEREYEVILTLPNNEKLLWLKKAITDSGFIKNIISKRRCDEKNKILQGTIVNENEKHYHQFKLIERNNIKSNHCIPDRMWAFIKKIKSRNEEKDKLNTDEERRKDPYNFCLVCYDCTTDFHPIFNFQMCSSCMVTYLDNFFEFDIEKQKKRFCVVCGVNKSEKYSKEGYIWVFCSSCIENYFQLSSNEITEHWICFLNNKCLCKGKKTKHDSGLFKVQKTWWNNLSDLYMEIRTGSDLFPLFSKMIYVVPNSNKKGTIKTRKLPVDLKADAKNYIEIYWKNKKIANEIRHILSSMQEKSMVLLLGSAGDISEPWVVWNKNQYVPVKDFELLFMRFYYIYCKIKELSLEKQIKMQWIFECSATIPGFTRKRNTRFLNVSPRIINIQKNKRDNGFRMIWTNIDETEEFFKSILNI